MRRAALALCLSLALAASACSHPGLNSFSTSSTIACRGEAVDVLWDVSGRASLRAERATGDWDEGEVPSKGKRTVGLGGDTSFTVTALDADPAKGHRTGTKVVQVPRSDNREAISTCAAGSTVYSGSFTLDATKQLRVRRLSIPEVTAQGRRFGHSLCVEHEGIEKTCIPKGGSIDLDAAAGGSWLLEADLDPDQIAPHPALRVQIDYDCR